MTENTKDDSSCSSESCFECTEALEGKPVIIRRLKRGYCPSCWIHHCDFRFRKRLFELGRPEKGSRLPPSLIRPSEHVLIYYDASESSLALLYLIRDAIRANNSAVPLVSPKDPPGLKGANEQKILPLPFTFSVLFIYDEMNGREKCMEKLKTVQDWQSETSLLFDLDFPIIVSSLECSLSHGGSELEDDGKGNRRSLIWHRIPSQSTHEQLAEFSRSRTDEERNEETSGDSMGLNSPAYSFPFNPPLHSLLKSMEKNVKSETSKKDFLQILREKLAFRIAKECEAKKIFVPEDQTFMAIKMFSLMSLGRGAQLAEQMGLGTEIEGVKFVRPLMDLSQDDLRDYLVCLREMTKMTTTTTTSVRKLSAFPTLSSSSQPLLSTDKGSEEQGGGGPGLGAGRRKIKGIQEQVEEFIVDLQHGYAATVPTLTRIGAKLKPQGDVTTTTTTSDKDNRSSLCSFCERNRSDTEDSESLELALCYGCTNILRDMRDSSSFRTWLQA